MRHLLKYQKHDVAVFQDIGSSPANMDASRCVGAYSCFGGHGDEQADAEQSCIQSKLLVIKHTEHK